MQVQYGTTAIGPANASEITQQRRVNFNNGGQAFSYTDSVQVGCWLSVSGQADCTAQMQAVRAALSFQQRDLVLLHDDNSRSAIGLQNAGSITGVRIVEGPTFDRSDGAIFASMQHFTFRAEAEYAYPAAGLLLLDFTESLTFWGGLPEYIVLKAASGPNQRQMTFPLEPYGASQEGSASGYLSYPTPPQPIWPFALKKAGRPRKTAPKRKGAGYEGFGISWSYEFESVAPLSFSTNPNIWK